MITIDKNGNAVFPEGIAEIKDCLDRKVRKELKKAVIPESVKKIDRYAFQYCENLEELVLPQGLEFIGRRAFENCRKLKCLVMPDSVTKIEDDAFVGVEFAEPVYNRDKSILYAYINTCKSDVIVLPDTVKVIFTGAFTKKVFGNIVLHEGLERIDSEAFFNCFFCDKLTVNCSTDIIKEGAFWNFRPMPKFEFSRGTPPYTEMLRMFGKIPVERVEELHVPNLTPSKNHKLKGLIAGCSKEKPDTMIKVAEFFLRGGTAKFYEAAANFWYYRAMLYGSEKAKEIIYEKCNREKRQLPTAAWPGIGNESGRRLNGLGFCFFDKNRNYIVSWPDENNIVKVRADAGFDGPDEDGFGYEEYYDWWLLDENLKEISGIRGIFGYSNLDRRNNEEMFERWYNEAVRSDKMTKEIRKRVEIYIQEFKNGNN